MKHVLSTILMFLFLIGSVSAGSVSAHENIKDTRVREYLTPQRIIYTEATKDSEIINAEALLEKGTGQSSLYQGNPCVLKNTEEGRVSVLVDFGKEFHGGLRFVTGQTSSQNPVAIRVRFGESVSEAMSNIGEKGAMNDHALRDFTMRLPWLGVAETPHSGFRFARIDLLEANAELILNELIGVFIYRDVPYRGSFQCNDERLNKIWEVGAYTVHLNMQEYLWDGIKRDRLVWLGDLHPEVMTVNRVFGYNEVVPKSLDFGRDTTPLPSWMSGISAYSLWWIIIHKDWYMYHADLGYLKEQKSYLQELLNLLLSKVDAEGKELLDGNRFLDWPSSENQKGVDAGLHALLLMALESGEYLCNKLGNLELAKKCLFTANKMKKHSFNPNNSKQAAALLALSGLESVKEMNKVIMKDGVSDFSTFYGYYMLQTMAKGGYYKEAMDYIKTYWGAMLDMGATTFWEDFNMEWIKNAARIDELVPEGKKDIHGDYGDYCYSGLRHSLCHGWASGPTSWLSEHVLGVTVLEPGCKKIEVKPNLGNLEWVQGSFPTPMGDVKIKHWKENNEVKSKVEAPVGIIVVLVQNK